MQLWLTFSLLDASPGLQTYSSSSAHLTSSDQSSRHLLEKNLLFSSNTSILISLTVPGMTVHQLQLIVDGKITCLMDFLNVRKTNLTHYQNRSIPQKRWMFPTDWSLSSMNLVYDLLSYHQRYGDQNSHQNKEHPITLMILMTFFF